MGQGRGAACLGSCCGGHTFDNNSSNEAWDKIFIAFGGIFGWLVPLPGSPGSF